eukprot:13067.XXX_630006_631277_1 [CDS] Oithona nana genome sequencing.
MSSIIESQVDRPKKQAWQKILLDILICLIVLGIIGLTGLGIIPPWPQSGIYCDDASIRFKYQGDSVPTLYLILGLLIPPLCLIFITEALHLSICGNQPLRKAWTICRRYYGCLISGMLFSTLLNEILKTLVAEPRPHFLDTCKPLSLNCSGPGSFVSYAQIECSQSNSARNGVPRALYDAMKSFPSGHAQLSTHCAVFVILYVQNRIGTHFSSLWKHLLQMVFLVFALVCSISRIVDKRHHWWDVLAGMLIGAVFAFVTVKWNTSNFQKHLKLESHQENAEDECDSNQRRYREGEDDEQSVRHRSTTTIVE